MHNDSQPLATTVEPPPVVLDPGDARYAADVLAEVAAGDSPSSERAAYALRHLQWAIDHPDEDADDPEQPTKFALYRLVDATGRVLYVGVTRNLPARMRAHRRNWGRLFTDVLVEHYPDAAAMLEAEAQAIHDEQPPLNAEGIG